MTKQFPRIRVVIQQNIIPHYRARIFELLSQCDGMHFTIVADTDSDTPFLQTLKSSDGREIRHLPARNRTIKIPGVPGISWQPMTLKILWRERPDVIIVNGTPYSLTAWAVGIMGRILGIPVLMWGHGLLTPESGPKWWIRRALYRLAAGQLLYGDHAKKLLTAKGFDPHSLHVVYNSLDYDLQQAVAAKINDEDRREFRQNLGVKTGEGLVVFTGRLQPVKRLDLVIMAIAELVSRGKRVHVAFVGDGSEKENLARLSQDRNVADLVHFLGASYDEHYLALVLSSADLSVIPSGAGLSIMHALAYGTPVLIHDRTEHHFPEWEAVAEGVTGFYYKYNDVNDLAEKMERAIFPLPAKATMIENCRQIIRERYNPHRQVEVFVQAIKETLTHHDAGRRRA